MSRPRFVSGSSCRHSSRGEWWRAKGGRGPLLLSTTHHVSCVEDASECKACGGKVRDGLLTVSL